MTTINGKIHVARANLGRLFVGKIKHLVRHIEFGMNSVESYRQHDHYASATEPIHRVDLGTFLVMPRVWARLNRARSAILFLC